MYNYGEGTRQISSVTSEEARLTKTIVLVECHKIEGNDCLLKSAT